MYFISDVACVYKVFITMTGVRLRQETEEDRRAIGSQNFIAR